MTRENIETKLVSFEIGRASKRTQLQYFFLDATQIVR